MRFKFDVTLVDTLFTLNHAICLSYMCTIQNSGWSTYRYIQYIQVESSIQSITVYTYWWLEYIHTAYYCVHVLASVRLAAVIGFWLDG